jgi:ATP-binding cassette subfamily F protein uup
VAEYVGGYSSWAEKGGRLVNMEQQAQGSVAKKDPEKSAVEQPHARPRTAKLSYKDQRELNALPDVISQLESRCAELENRISAPGFYQQDKEVTEPVLESLADTRSSLEAAYARWQELEG